MSIPGTIILSRPDALGDAVVTLSTAGWIKHNAPDTRIVALVKQYTRPVWAHCDHIDAIIIPCIHGCVGIGSNELNGSIEVYSFLLKLCIEVYATPLHVD